jgi:uncharacterized protein YgiM (DUF1202 family)
MVGRAWGASAVLSGIEIVGSQRGLALTLRADAPFGLSVKEPEKRGSGAVLSITCDRAIYGLDEFEFTAFPRQCPLKRIAVTESPASGSITMQLSFSSPPERPVQTRQKQNKWIVLLSRAPWPEFSWTAPSAEDAPPSPDKKQGTAPAPQEKNAASQLSDISILQRDRVEVLTFVFSGPTTMRLKREQDRIVVLFVNATSALPAARFAPKNGQVTGIELKQVAHGGTLWLGATIAMKQDASARALVRVSNDRLVIYNAHDSLERLSYWSAKGGSFSSYDFVKLPHYAIDYKGIEKRALTDGQSEVAPAKTFAIREEEAKKPAARPQQAAPAAAQGVPVQRTPAPAPREPPVVRLLISKDNVNLRSEPATSPGNVVAKLALGTVATQVQKKGAWVKIATEHSQGWVYSSMVVDSAKAPHPLLLVIERSRGKQAALQKAGQEKAEKDLAAVEKAQQEKLAKEKLLAEQQAQKKVAAEALAMKARDSAAATAAREDSVRKEKSAPRRTLVEYHVYGRDPFLPLSHDQETPVPNVEDLTLVGILYDQVDRIALFEDTHDKSLAYALRENDPVQNGYLLRVQPDKVLFLINELGISRTYALKLTKEKER